MANGRSQPTMIALVTDDASQSDTGGPANHRTIDRVTQILEEVVYHPGIGFAELARALDAPKSSVHGFIRACRPRAGSTNPTGAFISARPSTASRWRAGASGLAR